jgi:hypothetical protein
LYGCNGESDCPASHQDNVSQMVGFHLMIWHSPQVCQ